MFDLNFIKLVRSNLNNSFGPIETIPNQTFYILITCIIFIIIELSKKHNIE